jgi:hypothetical protein
MVKQLFTYFVKWHLPPPRASNSFVPNINSCTKNSLYCCKIWGFHGSDHEEWRLLGYINSVRTSQETYYVSATLSSQLMLCKIWGFHGSDYEECRLLGCYAVCGRCKNRRFRRTLRLYHQVDKANFVLSSRLNIPEDAILSAYKFAWLFVTCMLNTFRDQDYNSICC